MQTGSLDAAVTSSTSLISFRLEEISKNLTTGRGKSFWYMLEPLIVSKSVFDGLSKDEQKAVAEVGEELEEFALENAKKDDQQVAEIYQKAKVQVHDVDDGTIAKWKSIAEASAWKDFADRSAENARLLKLAAAVS